MKHIRVRVGAIVSTGLTCSLLASGYAHAGLFAASDEFQINTSTVGSQIQGNVAALAGGNFVVVWTDTNGSTYFNPVENLFGQRIDRDGTKIGTEFQIGLGGLDSEARAAAAPDGGFAVVWRRGFFSTHILARLFDESATPRGAEFFVSDDALANESSPDVAFLTSGRFIVGWAESTTVRLRQFTADGLALGTEFRPANLNGYAPRIASASDGGFVVAWGPALGSQAGNVYSRRFDASARGIGPTLLVNTSTVGLHDRPSVSVASNGNYVVAWTDYGEQFAFRKVMARSIGADGTPQGSEFEVASAPGGSDRDASVAHSPGGGFVVSWSSAEAPTDGTYYDVMARRFDTSATASGTEIQVNTFTPGQQMIGTVAPSTGTSFLVVWGSPEDGSGIGVFGRRIAMSDVCGDPDENSTITASDALIDLRAAVGAQQCDPCVCDVDDSGAVTARDALIELQLSVGQGPVLHCRSCV